MSTVESAISDKIAMNQLMQIQNYRGLLMNHLKFNCKEATRLVSESLDRKLPFHQRIGIRIHLLMCKFCSRYEKQLMFLRKTSRTQKMYEEDTESYTSLPPEARKRIKNFLHDNLDKPE